MKINSYTIMLLTSITSMVFLLLGCAKDIVDTTGSIFGKVTNTVTNEPVNGATITITPGGVSATAGSNGTFEFQDLTPGQYEIQVSKSDFATNTKRITVVAGESASGDIAITPTASNLKLSVSSLNFGKNDTQLSFSITNMGNAKLNWNISGLDGIDWLTPNPTSGSLESQKSNAVILTVDRNKLTKNSEAILLIQADQESVPLRVTAEFEATAEKVRLSTSALNFGQEYTSLSFTIENIGNSGVMDWTISGIDAAWIAVSPLSGKTDMGKSSAVKVELNRNLIKEKLTTQIMINAAGGSLPLAINAEEKQSGGGEEPSSKDIISCDDGIKVSLVSCKRNGSTLTLTYTLNNTGMEKDLDAFYIHPNNAANKNSFSDNLGNSYTGNGTSTSKVVLAWGGQTGTNQVISSPLPQDTPKQGSITIKEFNAEAASVTCKIYCAPPASYTLGSNWITFKNIEIK